MTFSIDNPEGGLQQPPLGKYVREKPSGEQGLTDQQLKTCDSGLVIYYTLTVSKR